MCAVLIQWFIFKLLCAVIHTRRNKEKMKTDRQTEKERDKKKKKKKKNVPCESPRIEFVRRRSRRLEYTTNLYLLHISSFKLVSANALLRNGGGVPVRSALLWIQEASEETTAGHH